VAGYRELVKQLEALDKQIANARETEIADAIERVRAIVSEYALTPEQVFAHPKGKRGGRNGPRRIKYRDPVSGATWTGMGREPLWIRGKPRDQFQYDAQ